MKTIYGSGIIAFLVSAGCSTQPQATDHYTARQPVILSEDVPADSTGSFADVALLFGSSKKTGFSLLEVEETNSGSLSIGDNVVLTYAKFNVAKIKLKSSKEVSKEEEELAEQEKEAESVLVEPIERMMELSDEDLALIRPENPGQSARKDEEKKLIMPPAERRMAYRGKAAEKRQELSQREKEQIHRETKQDSSTKFVGPYVYDAIAGALEGDVPATEVVDGSYKRIEFQLKRNFSAETEEPLFGKVFAMQGRVIKDGNSIPFEIDWHIALNFRMLGERSFLVEAHQENILIVDFNLQKWFEGIDLSSATVSADGTIYINKLSNRSIMRQLHRNIRKSTGFGRDWNQNGILDDEERAGSGVDVSDAE
jgi:hypothetical protein